MTRAQLIEQMHNSPPMSALRAQAAATAAMTRRAEALLQTGPDRGTVEAALTAALTRDGALPSSPPHHSAPGAPTPLPRQTLHAALATANAGVALSMGVPHQAPRSLQDAPTAMIAPTRESATPAATQPHYGGPALDAGLPTPEMVQEAVGTMFGLSATPPRRGR